MNQVKPSKPAPTGMVVPTALEMEQTIRAFMSPIMRLFHVNRADVFTINAIGKVLVGLKFDPPMTNVEMDLLVQHIADQSVADMKSYLLMKSVVTTPVV